MSSTQTSQRIRASLDHPVLDADGHLEFETFRAFTFENAVRFYGGLDPECLAGTVIADAAARVLSTPEHER